MGDRVERQMPRTAEEHAAFVAEKERERVQFEALQVKYSKGLVHTLRSTVGAARLRVVDYENSQANLQSLDVLSHLDQDVVPAEVDIKRFSPRMSVAVGEMLFVRKAKEEPNYVHEIGARDLKHTLRLASGIAQEGQQSGYVSRLVMGATQDMPYRALSYMLPSVVMMERMKQQGVEPSQLQIVFTNHIGSSLNHGNYEQARGQSQRLARVSQEYLKMFFKDVAQNVVFLEDTSMAEGESLREELERVTRVVDSVLPTDLRDTLINKGNANGNSLYYGAAHPLFHDRGGSDFIVPLTDIEQEAMIEPKGIISFGGKSEKFFYVLRQSVKDHLGENYNQIPTMQLITDHGVPPYMAAKDQETGITADMPLLSVMYGITPHPSYAATVAGYDLAYIEAVSKTRGDYAAFLERIRQPDMVH